MSEYIGEFVQESEESITELNNALLDLERSPDDDAAMDQVFRTAHTLKGNCGAMGFDNASDLAHAIEDLLDAVRGGSLEITPELMDEVFDAVDDLERMIGEVDRHGDVKTDPTSRIEALRSRIEDSTGLTAPSEDETASLLSGADRLPRSEHQAFHARIALAEDGSAETAVTALSDAFDLLATEPASADALATAAEMDAVFGSAVDEAAVAAALEPVDAVENVIIAEVADETVEAAVAGGDGAADAEPEPGEGVDTDDAAEMEVDDLLDEFDEYDDLDEAVDRVDDVAGLENMGEAGAFDDIVEEDVEPAYDEGEAGSEPVDASAGADTPQEAGADDEVEDAMSEFQALQQEVDPVDDLDEMEDELEGVEFGEFDDEDDMTFDELLGDEVLAEGADPEPEPAGADAEPAEAESGPEPAVADAEPEAEPADAEPTATDAEAEPAETDADAEPPAVTPASDDEIDALVETARPPSTLERGVHHARIAVPAGDADVGEEVVGALRDAFDLLGTDPAEPDVVVGEHGGEVDALFGSDLSDGEIRAALVDVEGVADVSLSEVTERVAPEAETNEPAAAGGEAEAEPAEPEPEPAEGDLDPEVIEAEGEIEDAMSEFKQMQQAYDTVGLDEIEDELEDVEFGEYDQEEEVGFDDLLEDAEVEDAADAGASAEPAESEAEPEPAEAAGTEPTASEAEPTEASEAEPTAADAEPEPVEAADADPEPAEPAAADAEPAETTGPAAWTDPDRAPTDAAVEAAVESVEESLPEERDGYHLALGVHTEPGRNNAKRVTDALRDAFDLLGTRPPESEIEAGDYDRLEAVLGSHVPETEIRSALVDVEEVGAIHVTDVTDLIRASEPAEPEPATAEDDEVEDAMTEFQAMQDEVEAVDPEDIEAEIEAAGIPGIDTDEEVGFDDLVEPAGGETGEPAAADADADAGGEAAGDTEPANADAAESGPESAEAAGAEADAEPAASESETEPAETTVEEVTVEESEIEGEPVVDALGDVEDPEEIDLEEIEVEGDLDDVAVGEEFGVGVDVDAESVTGGDDGAAPEPEPEPDPAASEPEPTPSEPEPSPVEPEPDPEPQPSSIEPEPEPEPESGPLPEEATADVETIKGIGSGYGERLAAADVETVGDLVAADTAALSEATEIGAARIEEWVERAPVTAEELTEPAAAAEPAPGEPEPDLPDAAADARSADTDESEAIQSIRVDVDQVDELLNLVEGLVTSRARMRRAMADAGIEHQPLEEELDELDVIGTEMQDVVMDMRLVPVRTVTQRLPRVVRDIARDQGKQVRFEVEGEDVEVDRSILSQMGDPLIHMVRNAVDHGIEPPEKRREAGKPEEGEVTLRAYRARDTVYVEVEDDGSGLDPDALREAAVEKGMYTEEEAERVTDQTARELIFQPGFSTTEEVTDVSGRGVGMDVVARTVEDLDGDVEIESELGEGTTIRLELPVSVAISEVLFMEVGDEEYGVPIKVVDEIEGMGAAQPVTDGGEVVRTGAGDERELIDLAEEMDARGRHEDRPMGGPEERGMLVTLEDDVRGAAIRCDRVRGQQEVVVKPFEGFMADIPGLSGAAILGEGDVVNILDVETL